jgi:hypothetical protein
MELLRMLVFVDLCHIPIALFDNLRRHLPILTEHCLVTVSAAGAHVSMHALTQQVLREHLMGNASNHALAAATAEVPDRMDEFDNFEHGTFFWQALRPPRQGRAVARRRAGVARRDSTSLRDVAFAFVDARRMLERSLSV